MEDEDNKSTGLGWLELFNFDNKPSDADSNKGGLALIGGSLSLFDEKSWSKVSKTASGSISDSSDAGGVFAWQNPEDSPILVEEVVVDVTSAASDTSDSTIQVGVASDDSSTADDILDGASTQATGVLDNINDSGTNGEGMVKLDANGETNDHITASEDTASVSGVEGNYYIKYRTL